MPIEKPSTRRVTAITGLSTVIVISLLLVCGVAFAQTTGADGSDSRKQLGSETAKGGFRNEDDIRDRFSNWKTDRHARNWLQAMDYSLTSVLSVSASKPHGGKADVEVTVETESGKRTERISIKLVSSERGFNQIDKRWLATYAGLWDMPQNVVAAMNCMSARHHPTKAVAIPGACT
jgi:hypothetical protein